MPSAGIAQQTSSVSSLQTLVEQLQAQLKALQEQVTSLQAQLKATKEEVAEVKAELKITRSLQRGAAGDEVKQLQEFLKQFKDVYPEGLVTGYFGPLTERAVQRWQEKQGIVNSGDPTTTGYGQVGPKTIAKINELIGVGAGQSGIIPPGLLTAPGVQKKLDNSTSMPPTVTSTPSITTPTQPTITPTSTATTTISTTSTTTYQPPPTYTYTSGGGSGTGGSASGTTSTGTSATTTATTATSSPPVFTITYPNGGEQWTAGNTYTITWTSVGAPVSTVNIELRKSGNVVAYPAYSAVNSGSVNWTVPNTTSSGSDYKVRIYNPSSEYYTYFDESNTSFTINTPGATTTPTVVIISPNDGEKLTVGQTFTIKWEEPTKTIRYFYAYLLNSSVSVLASNFIDFGTSFSGSYRNSTTLTLDSWIIPSSIAPGDYYKIRVIACLDGVSCQSKTSDDSDNYVSIVSATTSTATTTPAIALPAPTYIRADWSYGWWDIRANTMGRRLVFQYPTDSANKTTKFRLYVKNPGESSFNMAAEFNGIDSTSCSKADQSIVSQWMLDNNSGTCGYWNIHYVKPGSTSGYVVGATSFPLSTYAVGEYSFYVTAVNSSGQEGTPSSIAKLAYLSPLSITYPANNQVITESTPTFQWTMDSATPSTLPHFAVVFDSPSAANPIWSPYFSGGTSKTYAGPALDPAKQYILSVFGIDVDTAQNKSTLIMPSSVINFSVTTAATTTIKIQDFEYQFANISAIISRITKQVQRLLQER